MFGGAQDARIVSSFHQRTGVQELALVPGTGSFRTSAPSLLTSLRPWLAPVRNSVPDGAYSTVPSVELPSEWVSPAGQAVPGQAGAGTREQAAPRCSGRAGWCTRSGCAMPGRTNVLACPVARVSSSAPPLPEKTWNSARLPSGDQASSTGANRESGQRASWYLVPEGLMRSRVTGPEAPPSGRAVVSWARIQPGPTWSHGTRPGRPGRPAVAGGGWLGGGGHAGRGPGGEQDGSEDRGQRRSAQVHAFMTPLGPMWLHGGRSPIASVLNRRRDMEFDVEVEIPRGSRNKYEADHETGRIRLDRTLFTATQYPADYGFVPEHPGRGRRPARRAGPGPGAHVPRLPDPQPPDRDVPDDGREGR